MKTTAAEFIQRQIDTLILAAARFMQAGMFASAAKCRSAAAQRTEEWNNLTIEQAAAPAQPLTVEN